MSDAVIIMLAWALAGVSLSACVIAYLHTPDEED